VEAEGFQREEGAVRKGDGTVHGSLRENRWVRVEGQGIEGDVVSPPELSRMSRAFPDRPETPDLLNGRRNSFCVKTERIREHLRQILGVVLGGGHSSASAALEGYVETLRRRHRDLLVDTDLGWPIRDASTEALAGRRRGGKDSGESISIQLAMPPGIENLGATCYLSAQLQCLGQNLAFLDGILAWQSSSSSTATESPDSDAGAKRDSRDDRMDSVLECFQRLMANMRLGRSSTVQAGAFARALNLNNEEQQDPNEFSRLLRDRLQEAFQRAANGGSNGQRGLARLLPDIFRGMMVFETTCSFCQRVSRREESFEDMNVPIVKPTYQIEEDDYSGRSATNGRIGTRSRRAADRQTDVQYCLEKYFRDEVLDGDNKYDCDSCKAKRDAQRRLVLRELPKVLNVQLSRYVYDRDKKAKKKLRDKVLLPLHLTLPAVPPTDGDRDPFGVAHGGSFPSVPSCSTLESRRFLLCAVMSHRGRSANEGHYVAEAMDWSTGIWFKFNDEKVSCLYQPSCSYDPAKTAVITAHALGAGSIGAANDEKKSNAPLGSTDAYSMYYVDESFLASSVMESLRTNPIDKGGFCGAYFSQLPEVEHNSNPRALASTNKQDDATVADVPRSGSDRIDADSDVDDRFDSSSKRFTLRAFRAKAGTDVHTLQTFLCSPPSNGAPAAPGALRRSRRSRRASYPVGPFLGEDSVENVHLDLNVAALRLMCMEACDEFEPKHTLRLFITAPEESSFPAFEQTERRFPPFSSKCRAFNLIHDRNTVSLRSFCEDALGERVPAHFVPSGHLVVVVQSDYDETIYDQADDAIRRRLLETSNCSSDEDAKGGSHGLAKEKQRSAETGFSGTLLSSSLD